MLACLFFLIGAGALSAQELILPEGANQSFYAVHDPGAYDLPVGPWNRQSGLPIERVEGKIVIEAWQVPGTSHTPFQLIYPLRDALAQAGYDILLDCDAMTCGGYDFRFNTLVLPAPEIFVTLSDFHFISAQGPQGAMSLLTSRDERRGYIQIIRGGAGAEFTSPDILPAPKAPVEVFDFDNPEKDLEVTGHVVLSDLTFSSGSSALSHGSIASLDQVAAFLLEHRAAQVMLVGHTDATGSLEANQEISRARARAAMAYLVAQGVPESQLSAEGAGYMAPRASNLTASGRDINRRVEAVLLSVE